MTNEEKQAKLLKCKTPCPSLTRYRLGCRCDGCKEQARLDSRKTRYIKYKDYEY